MHLTKFQLLICDLKIIKAVGVVEGDLLGVDWAKFWLSHSCQVRSEHFEKLRVTLSVATVDSCAVEMAGMMYRLELLALRA